MLATMTMPGSYFERSRSPEDLSHHYQHEHTGSRKRPRLDSRSQFTPGPSEDTKLGASVSSIDIDIASPSPLANTDYFLSGGLDTPGGWQSQCYETRELNEYENDHRTSRFAQRQPLSPPATPSPHAVAQNNHHDGQATAHSLSGWHLRQMAWAVTGGLAGKLFNFCWNSTFSGFAAGGGTAYEVESSHRTKTTHTQSSTRPAGLNRDITSQDSVTKGSWVFVTQSLDTEQEESESPVRKRHRASIAPTKARPSLSSVAGRTRSDSASYASPRSRTNSLNFTRHASRPNSSHSHSRPSTIHPNTLYTHKSPTTPSTSSSSAPTRPKHGRTNSRNSLNVVSPRRQPSHLGVSANARVSPVSPEIEQFKRQKKRAERKQDESFRKLNAQLQDMIRQGQAALGSKVDVCGDYGEGDGVMDEGYFEDFND